MATNDKTVKYSIKVRGINRLRSRETKAIMMFKFDLIPSDILFYD